MTLLLCCSTHPMTMITAMTRALTMSPEPDVTAVAFLFHAFAGPRPTAHQVRGTDLLRGDDHLVTEPGRVAQRRRHAAAMRSSGSVTMGQPAHRTSQPVVCALHSGVSRNTSAMPDRRMCSCAQDRAESTR